MVSCITRFYRVGSVLSVCNTCEVALFGCGSAALGIPWLSESGSTESRPTVGNHCVEHRSQVLMGDLYLLSALISSFIFSTTAGNPPCVGGSPTVSECLAT